MPSRSATRPSRAGPFRHEESLKAFIARDGRVCSREQVAELAVYPGGCPSVFATGQDQHDINAGLRLWNDTSCEEQS